MTLIWYKNPKLFFWLAWSASLVLFLVPISAEQGMGLGLDKVVHFVIFVVLAFYGFRMNPKQTANIFILLIAYAFVIEYVQGNFLPYRSLDWADAIAGALGVLLVYIKRSLWVK